MIRALRHSLSCPQARSSGWRVGLMVCSLSVVAAAAAAPPASAADRGLFIGIDDYEFDALDLPPDSSTRDARALAELARDHLGFSAESIRVLENRDASHDGILDAIETWLIQGTGPGDRVILAYSGHGTHIDDDGTDEEDGQDEALVPWDTALDEATGKPVNLLRDDDLERQLAQLQDRDVLVLVDSCHSGTITRASPDPNDPDRVITRDAVGLRLAMMRASGGTLPGTVPTARTRSVGSTRGGGARDGLVPIETGGRVRVFAAAAADEAAYVDPKVTPEQGVFTRALIEGVGEGAADTNGNGVLSNAEVLMYLRRQSHRFCRSTRQCSSLTPTLETASAMIGRDFRTGAMADDRQQATTDRLAATPSADISLDILPGRTVHLGDSVTFQVRSSIDGHLVVLDMNAAGEVVQLFPNRFSEATGGAATIRTGVPVTIPDASYGFSFEAQPPTGRGSLVAIVSSRRLDLGGLLRENGDLGAIADPDAYVDRLAVALLAGGVAPESANGGPSGDSLSWGYATATYLIEP